MLEKIESLVTGSLVLEGMVISKFLRESIIMHISWIFLKNMEYMLLLML